MIFVCFLLYGSSGFFVIPAIVVTMVLILMILVGEFVLNFAIIVQIMREILGNSLMHLFSNFYTLKK